MTRDAFWLMVERSLALAAVFPAPRRGLLRRPVALSPGERHVLALDQLLGALPDDELASFQEHLDDLRAGLFRADLWGAGHLACGGMDEDAFTDLRTWLVSQGRAAYARIAADPDALADVAPPDLLERVADAEAWGYVALEVWDARHDEDMPRPGFREDGSATGTAWDQDDAEALAARYPRLAERFG